MRLSESQINHYQQAGYVPALDVMGQEEALGIRQELERFENQQGGRLLPNQRSRAFLLFKWLDNLIRDPRVLDPVEQLIGPNILCWSTIFWIKDARSKQFVDWHQDNPTGAYLAERCLQHGLQSLMPVRRPAVWR